MKNLIPFFVFMLFSLSSYAQNTDADSGYYYLNLGDNNTAAKYFENYIYNNPNDFKIRLQLGYIYFNQKNYQKALAEFEYVAKNSYDEKQIQDAKSAADVIRTQIPSTTQTIDSTKIPLPVTTMSYADSGYYYLNKGDKNTAAIYFEKHLQLNPKDSKTRLQLAYIYYDQKKLDKSLKNFNYVAKFSNDPADQEVSRSASFIVKEELAGVAPKSIDMYFYNYYDSFQENYIANFVGHYNFKISKNFYTGVYIDLYTDSKSTKDLIYNDRFVETGGFFRFNMLKNLFFEFRVGYTRQIDLEKSSINIKPLLVYFTRFGDTKVYVGSKATSRTSLFLDLYYAGMYDYKYKTGFIQAAFQEVLRFHTGGYSYMDSYLVQTAQFDSRKLDYNNYVEIGTGLRYHPNLIFFPTIFVEPTYKAYFYGTIKNSFQVKVDFYLFSEHHYERNFLHIIMDNVGTARYQRYR